MYQGQSEASAAPAEVTHPPINADKISGKDSPRRQQLSAADLRLLFYSEDNCDKLKAKFSGEENYAVAPPDTWRHRHRRQPKNKAPITKAVALQYVRRLREKYLALLGEPRIEATNHHRLVGDLAQKFSDLIERICDVDPRAKRGAAKKMLKLSKQSYGSLSATGSQLSAPVPDHWSNGDGEYLVPAQKHYRRTLAVCRRFENLVRRLSRIVPGRIFAGATMLEEKGINYLLPNPIDWHLALGVSQEKRGKIERTEVFQKFLDLAPKEEGYNPYWRKRDYND